MQHFSYVAHGLIWANCGGFIYAVLSLQASDFVFRMDAKYSSNCLESNLQVWAL